MWRFPRVCKIRFLVRSDVTGFPLPKWLYIFFSHPLRFISLLYPVVRLNYFCVFVYFFFSFSRVRMYFFFFCYLSKGRQRSAARKVKRMAKLKQYKDCTWSKGMIRRDEKFIRTQQRTSDLASWQLWAPRLGLPCFLPPGALGFGDGE